MKCKPYYCPGCGVLVTREPWPHLDRGLLALPTPAPTDNPKENPCKPQS